MIVAKVGGSLFDLPDLRQRLSVFLSTLDKVNVLFVPGGGAGADVVRQWDRIHVLGEEESHWLALRVLSVNAHFLSRLMDLPVVSSVETPLQSTAVLDAYEFCKHEDAQPGSLQHCWDVTSDSIAARAASITGADLVLLKSIELPTAMSWCEAADLGLVDRWFPKYATGVQVSWINLRQPSFAATLSAN